MCSSQEEELQEALRKMAGIKVKHGPCEAAIEPMLQRHIITLQRCFGLILELTTYAKHSIDPQCKTSATATSRLLQSDALLCCWMHSLLLTALTS